MVKVLLGLGSNCSFEGKSSLEILECCAEDLKEFIEELKMSSVYKTPPMYVLDQSWFFNAAVRGYVSDEITPSDLLKKINEIEEKYGRNRKKEIRNGPRSLDIDIEVFGEAVVDTLLLQIPHPRIKERAFVLVPSLEILDKSADKEIREKFENYLSLIDSSEKEKICQICSKL